MAKKKLPKKLRGTLVENLNVARMDSMFGDGLEMDYLTDGVTIKGTSEMSDKELVEEWGIQIGADTIETEDSQDDRDSNDEYQLYLEGCQALGMKTATGRKVV
jgi:hypothetical protein